MRGVNIEKDPSIEKLSKSVFEQLDKIANPEKPAKPVTKSGLAFHSLEDALRELSELKNKTPTSSISPQQ